MPGNTFRTQQKRINYDDSTARNNIPKDGELVIEKFPNGLVKMKVGNGIDTYANLPYLANSNKSDTSGAIDFIEVNGVEQAIVDKTVNITVPTKVSDLNNDSAFLAENQLKTINNQSIVGTGNIVIQGGSGSSDWDDIENKPSTFLPESHTHTIDDVTDMPTIPSKTSQLTNDSGFLTEHQDISGKADKTEIPVVPSNVSAFANDAGYLTEHQDISTLATKTEVEAVADSIPTNTSDLNNDSGFLIEHQTLKTINGKSLIGTGNIVIEGGGGGGGSNDWDDIINKPDTYPPTEHNHTVSDITDMPSIPTKTSDLDNDSNFLTEHQHIKTINNQTITGNGNITIESGVSDWEDITNKPSTFSPSEHTHSYSDLTDKPTIPSLDGYATEDWVEDKGYLTQHQDISGKANTADLATVATTGSYDDLSDKPDIPSEYVLPTGSADVKGGFKVGSGLTVEGDVLSATGGGTADSIDWSNVQNKPDTFTPSEHTHSQYLTSHQDISGKANTADLATVATSGDYDDLSNKPNIPTVPTNVSAFTNDAGYLTEHQDISGKQNKPVAENYTITTSEWTALSSSDPFKYSVTVTATHTLGTDITCELINDQAILFATYGFAIASVSGQTLTLYAIDKPSSSVTLEVQYYD